MHLDCTVDFALGAKQVTQRQVRLHGFVINLDQVDKQFDGLVGLVGQQVIEALNIGFSAIIKIVDGGSRIFWRGQASD